MTRILLTIASAALFVACLPMLVFLPLLWLHDRVEDARMGVGR